MMPQASDELRNEFPGSDYEALTYLEGFGLKSKRGLFGVHIDTEYPERVWKALQYLRDEWDYAIEAL